MGTTGPMRMEGANERVRDHAEDRSELHLVEDLDNGFLRYMDEMVLAGWRHQEGVPDVNRSPRRAIVFYLAPVHPESLSLPPPSITQPAAAGLWGMSMEDLKKKSRPGQARVDDAKPCDGSGSGAVPFACTCCAGRTASARAAGRPRHSRRRTGDPSWRPTTPAGYRKEAWTRRAR
jgi:hypothetical protein